MSPDTLQYDTVQTTPMNGYCSKAYNINVDYSLVDKVKVYNLGTIIFCYAIWCAAIWQKEWKNDDDDDDDAIFTQVI